MSRLTQWRPSPAPDQAPTLAKASCLYPTSGEALRDAWIVEGHVNGMGPMTTGNLLVRAGGARHVPMDYLWRSQASFLFDGGLWGMLRVLPDTRTQ